MSDPKLLHVYWLDAKGGECFIVGNRAGLLVLRHALQAAIEKGKTVGEQVTDPYKVTVIMEGSPLNSESWQRMALPYVAEGAVDVRENALWPSELWMMKERA